MRIGKDEILAEIHKFVAGNGGEIPGERTFVAATHIKTSAWTGIHWVRWTEAVREAGYDPNRKQPKIPDEEMLAQLAKFVTALGHFPVQGEFKMHARKTPGFPAWITICKRYGGMLETASALLEFGRETANNTLQKLCMQRIERELLKPTLLSNGEATKKAKIGYVYLKYSPSLRLYKIGKANNPAKRGAGISLLLPEDLVPKHEIRTDYPFILEKYWESRFRDKRKQGEWYQLSTADIKAFKARREFMFGEYFP